MQPALLPTALAAYGVGALLAGLAVFHRSQAARHGASVVFVVAWVAHLAATVARGVEIRQFPLNNMGEYLLVLSLAVMALHLFIWFLFRVDVAGLVLPPLSAAALAAAQLLLWHVTPRDPSAGNALLVIHTSLATLGMAILVVALTMSLLYVVQDRALKSRSTLAFLDRLPSLDRCERLSFQALVIGFVVFSAGIVSGVLFNAGVYQRLWVPGLKQSLPLLAWVVFALVLVARFRLGVRGRKNAYWTIAGVTLGLLTIFGMTL